MTELSEPSSEDEASRNQAEDGKPGSSNVEHPVCADRRRPSGRSAGREAVHRIGHEDAGSDQAQAIECKQPGRPGRGNAIFERSVDAEGAGDDHGAGEKEVADLDPAKGLIAQQAHIVPCQVETRTEDRLDEGRSDVDRTGDDTKSEQAPRYSRGRVAPLCGNWVA